MGKSIAAITRLVDEAFREHHPELCMERERERSGVPIEIGRIGFYVPNAGAGRMCLEEVLIMMMHDG